MKNNFTILLFLFSTLIGAQNNTCEVSNQCMYQLKLFSIDGSGWNGNTMSVIQNNEVTVTVGENFTSGAFMTIDFAVCDDAPFELLWNDGGQFSEKVKVILVSAYTQNIFIKEYGVGVPNSSLFSAVSNCNSDCCFFYPDTLTVNFVTENSAVLAWNSYFGANQWDVYVSSNISDQPFNFATVTGITTNPFEITELNSCTEYKFYVRYRCSETSVGNWSEQNVVFTTNCVLSDVNFQWDKIKIYPNPSTNTIHFSSIENVDRIEIFDVFGKLLNIINKGFITNSISIETFEQGVYFVKLNAENNSKTFRIIKE